MTTHALNSKESTYEPGLGFTILKFLDLIVMGLALPVFLIGGFPIVAWAIVTAAWSLQRFIEYVAQRHAVATGDRRMAIGVIGGALVGRIWLTGLAVFAAGLVEREAGLAAGLFALILFTVHFMTLFIVKPIETGSK